MTLVWYADVAAAVAPTGMIARGGFAPDPDDAVPPARDGSPTRTVVVIGNVSGTMWPAFRAAGTAGADPLDTWTRHVLAPIAADLGASYLHPSDRPYQPFQRWAQRADDVWPSPIGLLIHPEHGLWHAYRGAFLFADPIDGLPAVGERRSPCLDCAEQPCLHTCPVDAFGPDGYDVDACRGHLATGDEPRCLDDGCAARCACPVADGLRYEPDQMRFHMRAFAGMDG